MFPSAFWVIAYGNQNNLPQVPPELTEGVKSLKTKMNNCQSIKCLKKTHTLKPTKDTKQYGRCKKGHKTVYVNICINHEQCGRCSHKGHKNRIHKYSD